MSRSRIFKWDLIIFKIGECSQLVSFFLARLLKGWVSSSCVAPFYTCEWRFFFIRNKYWSSDRSSSYMAICTQESWTFLSSYLTLLQHGTLKITKIRSRMSCFFFFFLLQILVLPIFKHFLIELECWNFGCMFRLPFCMRIFRFFSNQAPLPPSGPPERI